jgi:phosphoglycerate dehydrogenase-like enzyme
MSDSRPKVVVTEAEYRKADACFLAAVGLECLPAPDVEHDLASAIRDSGARHAIVGLRTYSGPLYDALKPGGVIARFGVGHDGIDKGRATRARLLCTNAPGVLNESVAEHAMLLIAAAARHIVPVTAGMARNVWSPVTGAELRSKTLAIIGCGAIGRSLARIASLGYGMHVVGCTRPDTPLLALEHFRVVTNDFAAAVHEADFVSLHMPATGENVGFINRERLGYFDKRAWLINTARGSVVDEDELFAALAERRIAGAALDVFVKEPYSPAEGSGDLRSLPNVVLTPHVGGNTAEASLRIAQRALHNIALAEAREFARMDLLNPDVLK